MLVQGRPQWYATNYVQKGEQAKWELAPVDESISDEQRRAFKVASLAEMREKVAKLNAALPAPKPAENTGRAPVRMLHTKADAATLQKLFAVDPLLVLFWLHFEKYGMPLETGPHGQSQAMFVYLQRDVREIQAMMRNKNLPELEGSSEDACMSRIQAEEAKDGAWLLQIANACGIQPAPGALQFKADKFWRMTIKPIEPAQALFQLDSLAHGRKPN
ncbi:hypothetical protein V8J88_12030 [Massilia sp. W12]|uniref:hypothetical protein n=1 Tax=Massilia sp. W12 TaxID=3126507 RepID=UPI0030D62BAA